MSPHAPLAPEPHATAIGVRETLLIGAVGELAAILPVFVSLVRAIREMPADAGLAARELSVEQGAIEPPGPRGCPARGRDVRAQGPPSRIGTRTPRSRATSRACS